MNIPKIIFLSISFLLFPFFCQASSHNMERIFYMSQLREKDGIISVRKNADKIDILAPQFFAVSEDLELVGSLGENLNKLIDEKKIKVMPLVVNTGFKQDVMHNLLISEKAQDGVIKDMIAIAKKEKYIGWQFDFENINYNDRDLYSSFIEKAAKALHKNGLILSIAAVTRTSDYEDSDAFKNWGGVFDYERIAKAVDFISLMTYDDPNSVGPVASLPFIEKTLDYVKDKIPAEKLSFGIPLYNWSWSMSPFKKIYSSGSYAGLSYIMSKFNHKIGFDDKLGASWLAYSYDNKQYKIWYQDKRTFDGRIEIIDKNNFRGFSAWVLGAEDPEIWDSLEKSK